MTDTRPGVGIYQVVAAALGIIVGAITGAIGALVIMMPLNLCCYFWTFYIFLTAPCGAVGGAIIGCSIGLSKNLETWWAGFGGAVAVVIVCLILGLIGLWALVSTSERPTFEGVLIAMIVVPSYVAFGAAAGAIGGASASWRMTQPAWKWRR
jgi:hypothetical protein